jgi:ribosomal protein S18 acetylase RimI-like enzyme
MAKVHIIPAPGAAELAQCARWMARSEPWRTLGTGAERLTADMTDELRESYVALVDDEIAGVVVILMRGALRGYVQLLAVHPERRGRGIGRQLVAFAEERILAETPNVFIFVSSFNEGARRLYEDMGYEVVGELEDYLVRGHSELLLRKTTGPILG